MAELAHEQFGNVAFTWCTLQVMIDDRSDHFEYLFNHHDHGLRIGPIGIDDTELNAFIRLANIAFGDEQVDLHRLQTLRRGKKYHIRFVIARNAAWTHFRYNANTELVDPNGSLFALSGQELADLLKVLHRPLTQVGLQWPNERFSSCNADCDHEKWDDPKGYNPEAGSAWADAGVGPPGGFGLTTPQTVHDFDFDLLHNFDLRDTTPGSNHANDDQMDETPDAQPTGPNEPAGDTMDVTADAQPIGPNEPAEDMMDVTSDAQPTGPNEPVGDTMDVTPDAQPTGPNEPAGNRPTRPRAKTVGGHYTVSDCEKILDAVLADPDDRLEAFSNLLPNRQAHMLASKLQRLKHDFRHGTLSTPKREIPKNDLQKRTWNRVVSKVEQIVKDENPSAAAHAALPNASTMMYTVAVDSQSAEAAQSTNPDTRTVTTNPPGDSQSAEAAQSTLPDARAMTTDLPGDLQSVEAAQSTLPDGHTMVNDLPGNLESAQEAPPATQAQESSSSEVSDMPYKVTGRRSAWPFAVSGWPLEDIEELLMGKSIPNTCEEISHNQLPHRSEAELMTRLFYHVLNLQNKPFPRPNARAIATLDPEVVEAKLKELDELKADIIQKMKHNSRAANWTPAMYELLAQLRTQHKHDITKADRLMVTLASLKNGPTERR